MNSALPDAIRDAIRLLEELAGDPGTGLPVELFLFASRITPMVNVDLLIQDGGGRTLLTWRSDDYHGAGWHVPGGIIRYKETAHRRIREVARLELGASVEFEPAPIAVMESFARERNRGHFISLLYRCRLTSPPDPRLEARQTADGPPEAGSWRWHSGPPADLLEVHNMYRPFLTMLH
jgi:ADP-ribose pyrophosphatase YjhB (NUDIX family)